MYPPPPPPPPPPPAPPPRPQPSYYPNANNNEPYGAVHVTSMRATPQATRRRSSQETTHSSSPYPMPSPPAAFRTSAGGLNVMEPRTKRAYQHSVAVLIFLSPILAVLWLNPSPYPLQIFLFLALALYAIDLANEKDMMTLGIWLAFTVMSIVNAWFAIAQDEGEMYGGTWGTLLRVAVETLLFLCLACLCELQFQWLHSETPSFAISTERMLHSILPPISACVSTYHLTAILEGYWGIDRAATSCPFLFAATLACGMWWIGSCTTSFCIEEKKDVPFVLSSMNARLHSTLLLLVPPMIHVFAFRRRIMSFYASTDEWYDLILVWSIPYLLQYGIGYMQHPSTGLSKGPYSISSSLLFPQLGSTLRGAFVPMLVSGAAAFALQQRYLIPICHAVSYQFNGHNMPSSAVVSGYLTVSTVLSLLSIWVWERTSASTREPLFGEYHEDIVQLSLGLSGMFAGKALGMPWSLTPLPVLGFLGLSVWITTRMLRFLLVVLFALHSSAALLFSYRFAGIDYNVVLSAGIQVSLLRLGIVTVFASVVVGLVLGFAVRPPGGTGADILKKIDVPGLLLIAYSVMLTILECTLLKEPVPLHDNYEVEGLEDVEMDPDATMYTPLAAAVTSCGLTLIAYSMKRYKTISARSASIVLSVSIGKAVAVVSDMNGVDDAYISAVSEDEEFSDVRLGSRRMLQRCLVAALLLVAMVGPRAFLSPVHMKSTGSTRYKRSLGPSGKPVMGATGDVRRTLVVYALILLPMVLVMAVPLVISPLIGVLSGRYSGAYYSVKPTFSELGGFASSLWGLSCLSMINHYLPDGGGEAWKKASAMTFLMGLGITLCAPTLPGWIISSASKSGPSPFASISSLGTSTFKSGRSQSGGWGLVASALAVLLAVTGPLELRERRHASGRKDKSVFFRLMVFCLLFGCGVSWFITVQFMSEESFLPVFLTTTSCMAMSFFGTIACVMGYFLDLEDFGEVEQVVTVVAGACPIFLVISATSELVQEKAHPFGIGGWLSTYLFVCACIALAFSLALRSRESKNAATRGIGNVGCVVSWLFCIILLYGRFGVAGLDAAFDVTLILGVPASVFGTCFVSLILLALEGESSPLDRRSRIQRVTPSKQQKSSYIGLNLTSLTKSNRFAPPVAATVAVFLIASIYGVLFRGCGWILPGGAVPTSHEQVFSSIFGMKNRAESGSEAEDAAALAEKNLVHSQAMVTVARLSGAGFWTARSIFGPLLHLAGLASTIPSLYLLITSLWTRKPVPIGQATLALPLNLIPLVLCRGLPPLRALALIGGVGGLIQLLLSRRAEYNSRMSI